jgi:putative transposase
MEKIKPVSQLSSLIRVDTDPDKISCKYCRSTKVRRYGLVEGVQRYFCNDCRRKFSPNSQLFRMKTPVVQVSSAISKYYQGFSINQIRDFLNSRYSNFPSSKTVYGWITKYTAAAVKQFKDYYVETGEVWAIFDSTIKLNGTDYRCVDMIDIKTHYLLATRISIKRKKRDVKELLETAIARASKTPSLVFADKMKGINYQDSSISGGSSSFIAFGSLGDSGISSCTEWVRESFDERAKTLLKLKSIDSASRFIEGFAIYHNYLRPEKSLNGQTPAEIANVHYIVKSWLDITLMADSDITVLLAPVQGFQQTIDAGPKSNH